MTVINAMTDPGKSLTPYQYIAIGTQAPSAFAKSVGDNLKTYLRSAGHVSGKRCYAFISSKGLRKGKVLGSLMKVMESEGMYLKRSDVLAKANEAKAVGKRLHVENAAN